MSIVDRALATVGLKRADPSINFADWVGYFGSFNYGGMGYPFITGGQALGGKQEVPQQSYEGYVQAIYKTNGVIFACMAARMVLFAQARFQFRRIISGRPGELFGNQSLSILEKPWNNAITGDLLARVIQDADISGNFYGVRMAGGVRRLRPDWVTIVIGSKTLPENPAWASDAEPIGYIYRPGGPGGSAETEVFLPEQVAHFAPYPDPLFHARGMSWITPVIREVMGDAAATTHKLKFFENGAVPGLAVSLDKSITNPDVFSAFVKKMQEQHEGVLNAYRTLYLAGGATATPVGANLRQIDFKLVQGAGETRIAAAAGIPPIVVGLSEGLAASTYSNYGQAIRAFGRGTMAYLWQNMSGSFGHLVDVPPGAELWYDERHIKMLQEDEKDTADIQHVEAQSLELAVRGGWEPDSVVKAVMARDWSLLKHTGLFSVQMQTPGSLKMPEQPPVIPGEPKYPELPATSNKPGETGAPKALPAPQPATPAQPPKRDEDESELTTREQQVADRLARGLSNKEIASELDLSVKTIENHVNSVLRKLGVHSRTEVTEVHVHLPERMVESNVSVEPAPPAKVEVTVQPAQVEVPITVQPAAVTVEAPPQPDAPVVNVNVPPASRRRVTKEVQRDESGDITRITETEEEAT